ncbi:unnamed protein product [Mytilus coruscus]|uniref:RNase H type-1 domain-containing protein n=1 Tax=Mytilus coruscus TaxID=42192 RepID=A0A6J8DAI7_MYTCO|nr:unnamed protein product [Mytilus coruscus]
MDVYIDGACKNNGKPSAKASFGIFWEKNSTRNSSGLVPDTYKQTNNTGDLFAAVKCLQQVHQLSIVDVNIKTDSEYLRCEQLPNVEYDERKFERPKFPLFQQNNDKKNLFLIGSSTLKRMSARKMTTDNITTKVKTIRGGRIRDIEDCLIEYISEGKLNYVDVIAVHVGTNNVSDRDSVHTIINDHRNLIYTVKQSLPETQLIISSILPRPTDYKSNQIISVINQQLLRVEDNQVKILDNTSTKYLNETDCIHHLSRCPLDTILEIDDPDEELLSFINSFTEVLNHHAPLIKKRVKHVYQNEWINDEIKEGMKQRDYYHKKKDTYNYKFWRNKVKYLIENSKEKFYTDELLHAARDGDEDKLRRCLKGGANINTKQITTGWTALHSAAWFSYVGLIHVLIDNGIDRNIQNKEGYTALHLAAKAGSLNTVKVMLDKGCDPFVKTYVFGKKPRNMAYNEEIGKLLKASIVFFS